MEEQIIFKRIRPRINVDSELSVKEIDQRIKQYLKEDEFRCKCQSMEGYASFLPPEEEQHFWSPQLTITIDSEENGTKIRGLYGPRPAVWTMFVFFYAAIAFAFLIVSMVGLSYWSLDKQVTFLWLFPVLILIFLSLFLVAYFGQKIGQRQMTNLHRALEHILGQKIDLT